MTERNRVAILGAGPAGLGAALWLAGKGFSPVVLEARPWVGGNAGSFDLHGLRVDFGSHRLHPATDPHILDELRRLLGPDLVERPRHGRILLRGRWVRFPLKPGDLIRSAPPSFLLGAARDAVSRVARGVVPPSGRRAGEGISSTGDSPPLPSCTGSATFADLLRRGLGDTICRDFYFPYARKIWGLEPEEIDPVQATRRVEASSIGKLIHRLLPAFLSGGEGRKRSTFFYPLQGYGQISEALRDAAEGRGARILTNTPARSVDLGSEEIFLTAGAPGQQEEMACDHVWSTIPIAALARLVGPPAPERVQRAAESLEQRAMVLVYLVLETQRFTEFDAHYVPDPDIPFTRLSEPKNYSGRDTPRGKTVLCAEIPCSRDEALWTLSDSVLGERVQEGLARAGLPVRCPVLEVVTRRLPSAYPLYRKGYEDHLNVIDQWIRGLPGILTFGRQGLFAHDNAHHALFMARAAVECMGEDGRFDEKRWSAFREVFATHVVQD